MDWGAIIISILMLAAVGELAFIILWCRRNLPRLSKRLTDVQQEVLTKTQSQQDESFKILVEKLSTSIKASLPSPQEKVTDTTRVQEEAYKILLIAAQELSEAAEKLKIGPTPPSADIEGHITALTNQFNQAVQNFGVTMKSSLEGMNKERRQLLLEMGKQFSNQLTELGLMLQELEETLQLLSPSLSASSLVQPVAALMSAPATVATI